MPEADYRLMTEATGQRIAAALEALSGTGAAAAAARTNLDVYSTSEVDSAIQQSTADVIRTGDVVNNLTSGETKPVSSGAVYDAVLTYKGEIANVSLNTVLLPGFYQARNNLTDSPVSDPWGTLLVLAPKGNTALASTIQILVSQSGTIYSRRADKDW